MSTTTEGQLGRLLKERTSGRVFRLFSDHVKRQKNSYSKLDGVDGKEVVIEGKRLVNFNMIAYLGLEFHPRMIQAAQEALAQWGTFVGSARAAAESRLFEDLENRIAGFLGAEDAMLFTTVTLANHGIIPLLMKQGTLILLDLEAHSSVRRAATEAKGGGATVIDFQHDDFEQLERLLAENRSRFAHVMIALDGVYSMLGTYLDLPKYAELAARYEAFLYVDDAHGFGVIGPGGRGVVSHYGGSYEETIYVGSLEKSLASQGGFAVLPREARDLVRYTCPTYIFCGQLPAAHLASALAAFDILDAEGDRLRGRLFELIARVKDGLTEMGYELVESDQPFPLILVKVGDVYSVPRVSQFLFDAGIHVLTVGFPVIPIFRGAMVRISLSAAHTDEQVSQLLDAFRKLRDVVRPQSGAPRTPK
jgi:7-keto-8-aminopelargonate synthetase-like enzyme